MFGFASERAPLRHFNNELLNLPVRWDAGWYLQIVTDGYRYAAGDGAVQQNIVFFPAYPMLMRAVGRLLGGDMTGYVAAGMLISIASFAGALVYIYAFARDRVGDDTGGRHLSPGGVPFRHFFVSLYTESLFALVTAELFFFLEAAFARAALWGLLWADAANGALQAALGLLALAS